MQTVTIRRTTRDLPVMILIVVIALFPGLYIMSQNRVVGMLLTLLVLAIAVFGFIVIFKRHVSFALNSDGVVVGGTFYKWEDISAYRMEAATERYYSHEMNGYQEKDMHFIILTLKDGSSARISANQLSKTPAEIIALFDAYSILPSA